MVIPTSAPSILIFDLNRKFLLYKILERKFSQQLRSEIIKLFGINYVYEKNQENKTEKPKKTNDKIDKESATINKSNDSSTENTETDNTKIENSSRSSSKIESKLTLTNDLIYEYFSPMINSFEISREINFIYEYVLTSGNKYVVRFYLYKNCLILLIYNLNDPQYYANLDTFKTSSELTRQIYIDYYTNWFNKSLTSLLKFKFGICSDEKCFRLNNKDEIKCLYTKWSEYFLNDQSYFIEAIDQLVVNDDIKMKCRYFLDDLINFLSSMESIYSEFNYIDENYSQNDDDGGDLDFLMNNDEDDGIKTWSKNYGVEEFEKFFSDPTQINQFILAYNSKLLYKYKKSINKDKYGSNSSGTNSFLIDSSSIFMLLLEAAEFLKYTNNDENLSRNNSQENVDEDKFESVSNSAKSVSDDDSSSSDDEYNNMIYLKNKAKKEIETTASFVESFKTPISSFLKFDNTSIKSDSNFHSLPNFERSNSFVQTNIKFKNSESISSNLSQMDKKDQMSIEETLTLNNLKSAKNFKKTNCFLLNTNKLTISYYEVLYLKLSDNLCLILIKLHKFSKYCELMSDFENLLIDFNELIGKKQLKLVELEESNKKTNEEQIKRKFSILDGLINTQSTQEDKMDKNFLSFFVNKLIIFYDKLTNLKNDLNNKNLNPKKRLSLKNNLKQFNSIDENLANLNKSSKTFHSVDYNMNREETQQKNLIKYIHSLQVKLNQFTNNSQFKELVSFINNNGNISNETQTSNSFLLSLRQIETQINLIQTNLSDLFFELFLTNATTVSKNLIDLNNRRKRLSRKKSSISTSDNSLFKSIHLLEAIKNIFNKHLCHYLDYIDIKFKRNISMAFYSHKFIGLVHFSLINRQTNVGVLPTIDPVPDYNLNEFRINLAYRKYIPIVLTLLYKNDCTQFKFVDDKLELVFCYFIWFEDKNFNNVPIEFNDKQEPSKNGNASNVENKSNSLFEVNNFLYKKSKLANIVRDHGKYCPFGITSISYYDILKSICYPNAPDDSLTCYELISIFSTKTVTESIDNQLSFLYNYITRNVKDMC